MSLRRFRIDKNSISGETALMRDPDEIRHIRKVLRIRPGDEVILFDGEGEERLATLVSATPTEIFFRLSSNPAPSPSESPLRIILGLGLLKAAKFDWVLQKATELGVFEIRPFYSQRVVAHLRAEILPSRQARWQRISAEAAKQSRRAQIPRVYPPISFAEILSLDAGKALKILLWEGEKAKTLAGLFQEDWKTVFMLIGPEGGFAAQEAELAQTAGFHPIRLGPRILRAETAALAMVALVQFLAGDLK